MTVRAIALGAGAHIFRAAHVPAIEDLGIEVVGVFDVAAARAAEVAAKHGWPVAETIDGLFAAEAELAIVCTPHPAHADVALRALDRGLGVLVEKPLAARLSEIDRIAQASSATGRPVAVVQQHRFRTEVVEAARLIGTGALGRIHTARLIGAYPKRSVYYTDTAWRGTWRGEGGGVLLNQGLHDIDLLVHLLGMPSRVFASLHTLVHPIETEDTADLLIEWAGGATATVHVTSAARLDGNRLEVHGSAGSLRLDASGLSVSMSEQAFDLFAAAPGGHFDEFGMPEPPHRTPAGGGTHTDVYRDLLGSVSEGRRPAVDAVGARGAVEVITAAALSSARGESRRLPIDPAEADAFLDARVAASTLREIPA